MGGCISLPVHGDYTGVPAYSWTEDDVLRWLVVIGLEGYTTTFQARQINGTVTAISIQGHITPTWC